MKEEGNNSEMIVGNAERGGGCCGVGGVDVEEEVGCGLLLFFERDKKPRCVNVTKKKQYIEQYIATMHTTIHNNNT